MTAPTPNAPAGDERIYAELCPVCRHVSSFGEGRCWICLNAALLAARREVEALLRVAAAAQACLVLGGSLPNGLVDAIHEMRAAGVDALTLWNTAKNAAAIAATPEEKDHGPVQPKLESREDLHPTETQRKKEGLAAVPLAPAVHVPPATPAPGPPQPPRPRTPDCA